MIRWLVEKQRAHNEKTREQMQAKKEQRQRRQAERQAAADHSSSEAAPSAGGAPSEVLCRRCNAPVDIGTFGISFVSALILGAVLTLVGIWLLDLLPLIGIGVLIVSVGTLVLSPLIGLAHRGKRSCEGCGISWQPSEDENKAVHA